MLRLAADENFNGVIVRAIRRSNPELDIITVQEAGLSGSPDPDVLEWAARLGRVLLTHDVQTMRAFVSDRINAYLPMPGLIEVPSTLPIGRAIEAILMVALCSEEAEWQDLIIRLPL